MVGRRVMGRRRYYSRRLIWRKKKGSSHHDYSPDMKGKICLVDNILIKDKPLLDLSEASKYFGIGYKKLRQMATSDIGCVGCFMKNGSKWLVKREPLEKYLLRQDEI